MYLLLPKLLQQVHAYNADLSVLFSFFTNIFLHNDHFLFFEKQTPVCFLPQKIYLVNLFFLHFIRHFHYK